MDTCQGFHDVLVKCCVEKIDILENDLLHCNGFSKIAFHARKYVHSSWPSEYSSRETIILQYRHCARVLIRGYRVVTFVACVNPFG